MPGTADREPPTPVPPEVWLPARRAAVALLKPAERFLHVEAASGIVLIVTAAVALGWANSPWAESYDAFRHTPIRVGIGAWSMERDVHFWINDLLMTVFFLLAGLEIKRELVHGTLSEARKAALPLAAALGGMLVPAAIYAALNAAGPGAGGWGVPMATDIAFAVGILMLLGKRVPPALRVLLLAFAIIDDLGAILVIAVFYSTGFSLAGVAVAAAGFVMLLLFSRIGVRPGFALAFPLLLLWAGLYKAGIHPTIAGVILGLTIPARAWYGPGGFLHVTHRALDEFRALVKGGEPDKGLMEPLDRIAEAQREAVSPAVRAEEALHPWVAYGVMPLFALANAGVDLGGVQFAAAGATPVVLGVVLGLLLGKPLGVVLFSWLGIRLRLCVLPPGVTWSGMLAVGFAAGIGFTMAIFIAELAFYESPLLEVSKVGVLAATALSAVAALLMGRLGLPTESAANEPARTDSGAETSGSG